MQLSYTSRLICLAFCSAGILQVGLEWIAWTLAPRLFRQSAWTSARRLERSAFSLVLIARLSPWIVVLMAWLPAYMRDEDNLAPEHVGLIPIAAASCVLGFWLFGCVRLARAWVITQHYCRQCKPASCSLEGLPVLLHPSSHLTLAVTGVFRQRIVISQSLLAAGEFSPAALQVAYLHEGAHARHHDNLKRAVLSLLPHFSWATNGKPTLEQHWQLAAEVAADEAGVMGIPERSILLADLLVKMARETMPPALHGAFALLSRTDDLRIRIERLLPAGHSPLSGSGVPRSALARLQTLGLLMIIGAGLTSICYLGIHAGHRLAELLLHLG